MCLKNHVHTHTHTCHLNPPTSLCPPEHAHTQPSYQTYYYYYYYKYKLLLPRLMLPTEPDHIFAGGEAQLNLAYNPESPVDWRPLAQPLPLVCFPYRTLGQACAARCTGRGAKLLSMATEATTTATWLANSAAYRI